MSKFEMKFREDYYVILSCIKCGNKRFKLIRETLYCTKCGKKRTQPLGIWVCTLEQFLRSK